MELNTSTIKSSHYSYPPAIKAWQFYDKIIDIEILITLFCAVWYQIWYQKVNRCIFKIHKLSVFTIITRQLCRATVSDMNYIPEKSRRLIDLHCATNMMHTPTPNPFTIPGHSHEWRLQSITCRAISGVYIHPALHNCHMNMVNTLDLWILKMHQLLNNHSYVHNGWPFDIKFGIKLRRKEWYEFLYQLFCQ